MSARQSARLKGAASKAVAAAVTTTITTATTTSTAAVRGAKRSVSTTTKKKRTETVVTAVASETTTAIATQEQSDETNDSPPAKKTKVAPKEKKTPTAAKDAWGALFAKKSSASKSIGNGTGVQLKPAQAISSELQTKIDGYAAFEGLTPRAEATKLKVAAWNVNGLRALLKKEETVHVRAYLAQEDPDVLCLSETKIDKDELQKVMHCVFVAQSMIFWLEFTENLTKECVCGHYVITLAVE